MMMYTLQSLPSTVPEFGLIQTQNWCGDSPAKDMDELEEQIRAASPRYQIRKSTKGFSHGGYLQGEYAGSRKVDKARKNTIGRGERKDTRSCYNCGKTGHFKRDCKEAMRNTDFSLQEGQSNKDSKLTWLLQARILWSTIVTNRLFEPNIMMERGDSHHIEC
ncbi:unnamed protein product [Peronospora effusa]|nr:unnamed protein product [Peronospora effusa]